VRAREDALALTTMLFEDEVRPTKGIPTGGKKPASKQLKGAVAIIEELSTDWQPDHYEDCYRERLKRVIDAKRKRETIHAPKAEKEPEPVSDLMAALDETLERLRNGEDVREDQGGRAKNGRSRSSRQRKRSKSSR
jgi:DNA end-binding protein Ku